jgi:hypothetical protein
MITKRRIGWLAVLAAIGASAGPVAAQSCPDCGTGCGVRAKVSSACARLSPRAWIQSWCAPKPATICPGSCFGYFRTQWTAANQACPNWGTNCAEPPIGAVAQPVPVAPPPPALAPVPANAIPPASSQLVPQPSPSAVSPAPTSTPVSTAPEPTPAPKAASDNKTFVPIPVPPPEPIHTKLPLSPTPDLPTGKTHS